MRVAIIGAGPAGLGAAWHLRNTDVDWALYEAESFPGGLAASFQAEGYTWDVGGHILFSQYPDFTGLLDDLLPPADWVLHQRNAYVFLRGTWIPYPFQNNLRYLPEQERADCLRGLENAQQQRHRLPPPRNFEEFLCATMGSHLAQRFMIPFNTKIWGYPPSRLATGWVTERVAIPDLVRIRRNLEQQRDDMAWGPNARFRFPLRGGTGVIWSRLASRLPTDRLFYRHQVSGINPRGRRLSFADGTEVHYDVLISTMPLDQLLNLAALPDLESLAQTHLLHTSTHIIGLGFRGLPPPAAANRSWLYFPEDDFPFHRVTIFSNYSPCNAPAGHYSLMVEVAESAERPVRADGLVESCLAGLRATGLTTPDAVPEHVWSRRAEYAYPVPSLTRDAALDVILPALARMDIHSCGRFGSWKYEAGNMDHCFIMGRRAGVAATDR